MRGRRVDVMIVGGHSRLFELSRLNVAELPECHANLHAKLAYRTDSLEHLFKLSVTIAHALPGGTHAKAG